MKNELRIWDTFHAKVPTKNYILGMVGFLIIA